KIKKDKSRVSKTFFILFYFFSRSLPQANIPANSPPLITRECNRFDRLNSSQSFK
ncbi:hypothetical protein MKW92_040199, partial [Papaver armeniacum]